MKAIVCLLIMLMACSIIVSAIEPLPKTKCLWTRPATEYRPEKTYTGSWGRFSDGSIRCFAPFKGKSHLATQKTRLTCTTNDVCVNEETCDEVCHWIPYCNFWKHGRCWNYHWEYECHEECHTETICHEETTCS